MPDCGGSDHERAIGNRFGYSFEFSCAGQQIGGAYGGASILKCHIVGVHHPQVKKPKIAHRPSSGADIEGVARVYQDNAQAIEFSRSRQARNILRQLPLWQPPSKFRSAYVDCGSKPLTVTAISMGEEM